MAQREPVEVKIVPDVHKARGLSNSRWRRAVAPTHLVGNRIRYSVLLMAVARIPARAEELLLALEDTEDFNSLKFHGICKQNVCGVSVTALRMLHVMVFF